MAARSKKKRAPSNALLAKAIFKLSERVEALENAHEKRPIGFRPPDTGEYEGSVGGDLVRQDSFLTDPVDRRAPPVLRVRRNRRRK